MAEARTRSLWWLLLALTALDASVTFVNVWPTPLVWWGGQLSLELALLMLLLAVLQRSGGPSRGTLRLLTVGWLLLVLGRYTFVTAPALWGRELNFYWDLRFLPDVFAMLAKAAAWWVIALAVVGIALALAIAYGLVGWALGQVNLAMADARRRSTLAAMSLAMTAGFAVQSLWLGASGTPLFAAPVMAGYGHQLRVIAKAVSGRIPLPASPSFESDLSRLHGDDVLLFFIESYGAVAYERPEFNDQLTTRRAMLDAAIHDSGNDVVSAFVTSPTFGGSSWFAHISLMSGLTISDPDENAMLMREQRTTLPAAMAQRGYRSIALMPGLWTPWPEGRFYGFAEIHNGRTLEYPGPPFGWWDMPDQFTMATLDRLERDKAPRPPLFVFYPTVSTHTPFSPVAPFQPDWDRIVTAHPFDDRDLERIYDEPVDWTNLGPGYAKSINYIYETLAGYVTKHRNQPMVMIVIGDHQPPALVSGKNAPWDVPVHVITSNAEVLNRLRSRGFIAGLTPRRPTLGPMASLLPVLMEAFGDPPRVNAN